MAEEVVVLGRFWVECWVADFLADILWCKQSGTTGRETGIQVPIEWAISEKNKTLPREWSKISIHGKLEMKEEVLLLPKRRWISQTEGTKWDFDKR